MNLEDDLKRVLRQQSPAPGFAQRVLTRIEREERHVVPQRRQTGWWRAAAASLTLAALVGGWEAHQVQERREGERAREQVLLAMHLAGAKVRFAQQQVLEIGKHD